MLLAKLYWESNPTVLDLTPLGGSARLVSAVTISPPFFHVFVTQRKALAVCFSTFVIWTDWSLRTKDSEFVELKSPSVISSYLRSSSLTYNLFTLGSKACLVLLLLWGLSQFRVLTLVTSGCVPELPSFTTARKYLGKPCFHWKHWQNSHCFQWEQNWAWTQAMQGRVWCHWQRALGGEADLFSCYS